MKVDFSSGYDNVTTAALTQWDKGQVLQIYGLNLNAVEQVHFANKASESAIVLLAYKQSGGYSEVKIPNTLLESELDISAFVYVTSGSEGKTVKTVKIPVTARTKPDDFVSEPDDISEQTIIEELIAYCNEVCVKTNYLRPITKAEFEALETKEEGVMYVFTDDTTLEDIDAALTELNDSIDEHTTAINGVLNGTTLVPCADSAVYTETIKRLNVPFEEGAASVTVPKAGIYFCTVAAHSAAPTRRQVVLCVYDLNTAVEAHLPPVGDVEAQRVIYKDNAITVEDNVFINISYIPFFVEG